MGRAVPREVALTPENRVRLVRAVVERVRVDEPANKVTVVLADIGQGDGDGATAEAGVVEEGVAA